MQTRLPPEVNRVLYVRYGGTATRRCGPAQANTCSRLGHRNLPFNITADEMFDIFGKYGAIRQIRVCVPQRRVLAPVANTLTQTAVFASQGLHKGDTRHGVCGV